jgi:hypothetical protein
MKNSINFLKSLVATLKGGEGSGNFGHEGRPGEQGGSGEGGGGGSGSLKTKLTIPNAEKKLSARGLKLHGAEPWKPGSKKTMWELSDSKGKRFSASAKDIEGFLNSDVSVDEYFSNREG